MAWDSSDLILAGSTALFGLIAGQTGAWVQSRRDAKTQAARDVAENERLTKQLDAQAQQFESQRQQSDIIDWRDRRIAALRSVHDSASAVWSALHGGDSRSSDRMSQAEYRAMQDLIDVYRSAMTEADLMINRSASAIGWELNETMDELIDIVWGLRITRWRLALAERAANGDDDAEKQLADAAPFFADGTKRSMTVEGLKNDVEASQGVLGRVNSRGGTATPLARRRPEAARSRGLRVLTLPYVTTPTYPGRSSPACARSSWFYLQVLNRQASSSYASGGRNRLQTPPGT